MLAVKLGGSALARRGGSEPGIARVVARLRRSRSASSRWSSASTGAQLSRAVEAEADAFALRLTDDPGALIDLQTRLAERNLSDPDPPAWSQFLFGSHPTTLERIGAAEAYGE